jgi:3-hydroxybutyryl-CoA dehydratase
MRTLQRRATRRRVRVSAPSLPRDLQLQHNIISHTPLQANVCCEVAMLDNQPRGTICIEDIEIGMVRSLTKDVTDRDIALFAEVSTDHNPVHLDEDYAQQTIFGGRIAHGMLTAGLVSAVIGEQLPGHGTVYLGQSLKFLGPVRPGDRVTAEVEVTAIDHARRRVTMDTRCLVGGKKVLAGEALVLAPSRKFD